MNSEDAAAKLADPEALMEVDSDLAWLLIVVATMAVCVSFGRCS